MSWLPDLKVPILDFIADNPGIDAVTIAYSFMEDMATINEYIDELLFERRVYWILDTF